MKINNFRKINEYKVWSKRKKKEILERRRGQDAISLHPYQAFVVVIVSLDWQT